MNKRGISAVVATVLIILITVAAVTLVWQAIIPMIKDNLDFSELEGRVEIVTSAGYTFYDASANMASVQVKRDVDDVEMNDVVVIFSVDGNSFSSKVAAPAPGNTKVYTFDMSKYGEPDSVSIAPVFTIGNKEKESSVTSEIDVSKYSGSMSSSSNLNLVVAEESLTSTDSWDNGTGSVTGYSQNGGTTENVREIGVSPNGNDELLWVAVPDSSSNADGGWNGENIDIDHTKTYRMTVWIKKTGSNSGTTYFGTQGYQVTYMNGNSANNPYFFCGDLPELNKWYLLVGYVHGSGYTGTTSYSGIYDGVTGEKVWSADSVGNCRTDFKLKTSATYLKHRAYLYYDTTTTNRQYFWNPTFTDVSGYELPLEVQI